MCFFFFGQRLQDIYVRRTDMISMPAAGVLDLGLGIAGLLRTALDLFGFYSPSPAQHAPRMAHFCFRPALAGRLGLAGTAGFFAAGNNVKKKQSITTSQHVPKEQPGTITCFSFVSVPGHGDHAPLFEL